jgi:hypothetical protein
MSSAPATTNPATTASTLEERVAALEAALALPPALVGAAPASASSPSSPSSESALRVALARQNYRILHLVRALDQYQARAVAAEAALAQHQQQTRR